jgi:glycosyltransferase A (GT-A) superfamily protein (DUF2064 family)
MSSEKQEVMTWLKKKDNGRTLSSFFFKRGNNLEYVRAGSTFQRTHRDSMVETAQVLSVGTDSCGIPHVRFQVSFRRPNRNKFDGGARMLALKSFADQYRERVSSLGAAVGSTTTN